MRGRNAPSVSEGSLTEGRFAKQRRKRPRAIELLRGEIGHEATDIASFGLRVTSAEKIDGGLDTCFNKENSIDS